MKDTFYLIVSNSKVERMVKTHRAAKDLNRGEIPVKVNLEIPDTNWKPPYLEKDIVVNRWDEGIDVEDVNFDGQYVTEEEADMIRQHRIQKMKEILEQQGFTVAKLED
ncbi:hypothetical protein [Gracilimonas tropica]|uniref:hypothetical protein n=1 Tax=Gracilimonas tropica TaxID=454600 RepID=UPI0003620121|nr:hypothetical protein [Gracilimonas tropica]